MKNRENHWILALFLCYAAVMLWLLFDREGPMESGEYWQQVAKHYNFRPLYTLRQFWRLLWSSEPAFVRLAVINLAGNVIMFVPLGYFLPRLFSPLRRLSRTLLVSGAVVALVELTQMLTLVGCCDVDDLLLNVLGAAVGYLAYDRIWKHKTRTA